MPNYEYCCQNCGYEFTELRTVQSRNQTGECPKCEGLTSREYRTASNVQAFAGSDRHRSQRDKWLNMVNEAQSEGVQSQTEMEVGLEQAHDHAKKQGIPVDKILGKKGKKPKLTPELKQQFAKITRDQFNSIKR